MSIDSQAVEPARKSRRKAAKSNGRPAVKPIKTAVSLSPATMRRLVIFAAMTDRTHSQVVAELIDDHCTRYVVSDRGKDKSSSEDFADDSSEEVSAAA